MRSFIALAVAVVGLVFAVPANAEANSCGGARSAPKTGLGLDITEAERVACKRAWNVARSFDRAGWEQVSEAESDTRAVVYDSRDRKWACRVTAWATGSDPGYNPFTKVRCTRPGKAVRFRFSS